MSSSEPKSTVALVRCESYEPETVYQAIGCGLDLLGGAAQFVRESDSILLKPNLLSGNIPDDAVTTHPAVFSAVARHLKEAGAKLTFGDSPGFGSPAGASRKAGLMDVAQALGIPLADMVHGETVSYPEGNLIKQFEIARGVLAADGIVSLPKLKAHGLTRITGACKNQFGCIPGVLKAEFHARLPYVDLFSQMLVDLNALLKPRLYVMDGVIGMEGNGPRNGDPRPMHVILLSADPVALDATVARMVDLDPNLVEVLVHGQEHGLGNKDADRITLVGEPLDSFAQTEFAVNRNLVSTTGSSNHGWVYDLFKQFVVPRPEIQAERCTGCGTCVRICPVTPKAVDFAPGAAKGAPPVHNYEHCIRCYCCQELCPESAITIKTPFFGRWLHH